MNQYTYFALGIVLGISLAVYYFMNREEKIEKRIVLDQQIYSTPKLDKTMENVVDKINLNQDAILLNLDGTTPLFVHQYDRQEELENIFTEKYL